MSHPPALALPRLLRLARREAVAVGLAVAILAAVVAVRESRGAYQPPPARYVAAPQSPALEERFGIDVTQIGLTANGGLLDLRYVVLDPDKAAPIATKLRLLPRLVVERNGVVLNSAALRLHTHDLAAGRSYYLLFRNDGGLLRRGDLVTLVIDGVRLPHIVVL